MIYIILLIWIAGVALTWPVISKWNNTKPVKFAACIMWPLTMVLYGIYYLHMKM